MILTMLDKNEFLKAAIKASDVQDLKRWLVEVVDAADTSDPDGKRAVAVPPFRPQADAPASLPEPGPAQHPYPAWGQGTLPAGNGERRDR